MLANGAKLEYKEKSDASRFFRKLTGSGSIPERSAAPA